MKINPQIKVVADAFNRKIDKAKGNLALAVRLAAKVNGVMVRRVEVDRVTGQITETFRSTAHPMEIARAAATVARCEAEIAALVDARDLAIMGVEIADEAKGRREGARRARDAYTLACVEEGIDRTVDMDEASAA